MDLKSIKKAVSKAVDDAEVGVNQFGHHLEKGFKKAGGPC
jgi:hypothetical protein